MEAAVVSYIFFAYIVGGFPNRSSKDWYDSLEKIDIPPSVFMIVWALLYILIAALWIKSSFTSFYVNLLFSLLVFLLGIWPFIFFSVRSIKGGMLGIVLTIITLLFAMGYYVKDIGNEGYWLLVLLAWLLFALFLNYKVYSSNQLVEK